MDEEKSLCTLLYKFLMVRIRVGYYRLGEQISSKPICELFQISNVTVRNALKRLEEEQYVLLTKNMRATVIWDAAAAGPLPEDFAVDQDSLADLYRSYALLLPGILWQGLCLYDCDKLTELEKVPEKVTIVSDKPTLYLFKQLIKGLGNPLLMDLGRDILLYSYSAVLKYLPNSPNLDQDILDVLHQ